MSTAVNPPSNNPGEDPGRNPADKPISDTTNGPTDRPDPNGASAVDPGPSRQDVLAEQKDRFGGMQFGACFFGWLTATGTAVLLTGLLAAAGTAFGLGNPDAAEQAQNTNAQTIGLIGAVTLLVVVLLAYFCGGYVAGRMARFNGLRQGVGVWLWAVIIAVVVAILSAVAGAQFNVLGNLNGFPRIPINEGTLSTAGILTAIGLALVSLLGAVLGGLTGMAYHRRVDKAGFDAAGHR